MKFKFLLPVTVLLFFCLKNINAQDLKTENVFLITLDGLRWQELFGGADSTLIADMDFVKDTTCLLYTSDAADE